MQKKSFLSLMALTLFSLVTSTMPLQASTNQPLHHKALLLLDGLVIDSEVIRSMIHAIQNVRKIQYGTRQQGSHHRIGRYVFRGEPHSIHSLIEYENLKNGDKQLTQELAELFEHIKLDFATLMKPFITQIQPFRHTVHEIMKEWAELHNRHDSLILEWGNQKHGTEEELFNQSITSFEAFNSFCTDMVYFLEDLIKSCPISYQQYLDSIKKKS
jgi:hypothetical protein